MQKLLAEGYPLATIEEVIAALAEAGWQSDERFVENYLRQRIRQGYGPLRLQQELRLRGIETDLIHDRIRVLENEWDDLIERVYRKKFRDSLSASLNEWAKRSHFLQYRGFTADQIHTLFSRLKQSC